MKIKERDYKIKYYKTNCFDKTSQAKTLWTLFFTRSCKI